MNDDEMCDCCNDNGCIYFHRIAQRIDSDEYCIEIGIRTNDEIKPLCVWGHYDDINSAEIAADAFINGMVYMNRITPSTLN